VSTTSTDSGFLVLGGVFGLLGLFRGWAEPLRCPGGAVFGVGGERGPSGPQGNQRRPQTRSFGRYVKFRHKNGLVCLYFDVLGPVGLGFCPAGAAIGGAGVRMTAATCWR